MTTLRLILGDQLNVAHSWFREIRGDVVYVMMEVRSETDYVRHHAQKVLALFASMRAFAEAINKAGHRVRYYRISDLDNRHNFTDNLRQTAIAEKADAWERMEADEWRVEQLLLATAGVLGIPATIVDAEHFILKRDEIGGEFSGRVPRMEVFYRDIRKRLGLLLDEAGKPLGGKWNYDAENRARWTGEPVAPAWPWHGHDLRSLWDEIVSAGISTMGEPGAASVKWPTSRKEARAGLKRFISGSLQHFGRYQDAMSDASALLFHSGLSFALNTKMLHPLEVVNAAIDSLDDGAAPLAAVEGFVRQIIGWREFVRGVYWGRMPGYAKSNYFEAKRPLPQWYWTGKTGMACLADAIGNSLSLAYAHHIQRLMLTGNFALLAGIDPDEVDAWYLGIYIDAFEWVELPNTRGMSQFADGGLLASKPYAAGANYIGKQSTYCKTCKYDPKRRSGDGACPFNPLYWNFIDQHADKLKGNPRMSLPYGHWNAVDAGEKEAIRQTAREYLLRVNEL